MTWLSQTSSGSLPTLFGTAVPVIMQGGLRQTARNVMQLGWRRLASRPASCGQAGRTGDGLGSEWSAVSTRDSAAPQQTSVFVVASAARTPCCCGEGGRWWAEHGAPGGLQRWPPAAIQWCQQSSLPTCAFVANQAAQGSGSPSNRNSLASPTSSRLSSTVEGSTSGWEVLLEVPAVRVSLSIRICS